MHIYWNHGIEFLMRTIWYKKIFTTVLHIIFSLNKLLWKFKSFYFIFSDIPHPAEFKKRKRGKTTEGIIQEDVVKNPEGTRRPLFLPLPYEHKMYNLMLHSPGSDKFGFNNLMSPFSYHSFRYQELCSPTSPVAPHIPSPTPIIDPGFSNRTCPNPATPTKEQLDSVNNFVKPSISLLKVSKWQTND